MPQLIAGYGFFIALMKTGYGKNSKFARQENGLNKQTVWMIDSIIGAPATGPRLKRTESMRNCYRLYQALRGATVTNDAPP